MLDQHSFSVTCHTWFGLYVFEDQVGGGVSNSWVQNYLDFIEKKRMYQTHFLEPTKIGYNFRK